MEILKVLNPENATKKEISIYSTRNAIRAIVFDNNGQIALLHVSVGDYYKIPGGGIEENEDPKDALERECLEEIGCQIEIVNKIGRIIEHRKMYQINQISDCYLAKVKGEKNHPKFTANEIAKGFKVVWLPFAEAINAISNSGAQTFDASGYMVPRDTTFLKQSQKYLAELI